jgi:hypothetical protein
LRTAVEALSCEMLLLWFTLVELVEALLNALLS